MDEPVEDISSVKPGEITVKATITNKYAHRIKNGNLMTDVVIADKTGSTKAVWFSKQPKEDLVVGSEYIFSGNYQLKYGRLALQSPKYEATGETPPTEELAESPLILPTRNYQSRKTTRFRWPDWIGGAIVWILIIGGIAAWAISSHSNGTPTSNNSSQTYSSGSGTSSPQSSDPSTTTLPPAPSTITGNHNGIPEIHTPTQADANSTCTDVTSYDYDWDDDVLCTRPDGSQFYTNYAGGDAADSNFHE